MDAKSSSEEVAWGRYLDTRSQRGRACHLGNFRVAQTTPPPYVDPPRPISPASHASDSHALHQSSHRVEFHFEFSFNQPIVTTFVTVTLREEMPSLISPPRPSPIPSPLGPNPVLDVNIPVRPVAPSGPALSDLGKQPMQVDVDITSKDGEQKEDVEDPEDEYWCRIVEEPPSPAHES